MMPICPENDIKITRLTTPVDHLTTILWSFLVQSGIIGFKCHGMTHIRLHMGHMIWSNVDNGLIPNHSSGYDDANTIMPGLKTLNDTGY